MNYDFKELLVYAILASKKAGDAILDVYHSDFSIEKKVDNSPLTIADKKAHAIINDTLKKKFPELPLLSEEGKDIPYEERKQWEYYWLVDPLDGTKEFIKRNGEFTVNIALIEQHSPVMGVIYIPVRDTLFFGVNKTGSFKIDNFTNYFPIDIEIDTFDIIELYNKFIILNALKLPLTRRRNNSEITVIGSRSHMNTETKNYIKALEKKYARINVLNAGSSYKLCMIAEGRADIYPRFAPTMEWDTAAGQIIVEEAGCAVRNPTTLKPLEYNKKNLINPWFIVESTRSSRVI